MRFWRMGIRNKGFNTCFYLQTVVKYPIIRNTCINLLLTGWKTPDMLCNFQPVKCYGFGLRKVRT